MLNWIFKLFDKQVLTIFSFLVVSILIVKTFLKALSQSQFDKLFLLKDQRKWTDFLSVFATFLGINLFINIYLLSLTSSNIIQKYKVIYDLVLNIIAIIFICSSSLLLFQWIYILIMRYIFKVDIAKFKQRDKMESYLMILIPVSLLTMFFIGSSLLYRLYSNQLFNGKVQNLYMTIFGSIIFFLFSYFNLNILPKRIFSFFKMIPNGKTNYKMIIPDQEKIQNRPLFLLYSLDSDHLVLGDNENELDSNNLFLYNKKENRYLQFIKKRID